jgi:hypothetical protein
MVCRSSSKPVRPPKTNCQKAARHHRRLMAVMQIYA